MPSFGADLKYFLAGVYQPPPASEESGQIVLAAWPYVEILYTKTGAEVLKAIQKFVAMIEATHVARAVFRIHSDRGGEFVNTGLEAWAAEKAILLSTTEGHDPAGNGQAESYIGKVKQRARAMLAMSDLGTDFWTFGVKHAALCSRAQAQQRRLPEIPVFGKKAFARVKDRDTDDFAPRAVRVVFLGLDDRVTNGKVVMYENGYIDVNSVVHEVMSEVGVEELPSTFAPQGPRPAARDPEPIENSGPKLEEPSESADPEQSHEANNFDQTGEVSSWFCPACRGNTELTRWSQVNVRRQSREKKHHHRSCQQKRARNSREKECLKHVAARPPRRDRQCQKEPLEPKLWKRVRQRMCNKSWRKCFEI